MQEFGEHQGFDFQVFVAVAKIGRRPDSADFPGFCTSKVLPLADVASKQCHFGAFSRSSAVEACRCWQGSITAALDMLYPVCRLRAHADANAHAYKLDAPVPSRSFDGRVAKYIHPCQESQR